MTPLLKTVVLAAFLALLGCGERGRTTAPISWDFSQSRNLDALNGGVWSPPKPGLPEASYLYILEFEEAATFNIRLNDRALQLRDVRYVSASRNSGKIEHVVIGLGSFDRLQAADVFKDACVEWMENVSPHFESWSNLGDSPKGRSYYAEILREANGEQMPEVTLEIRPGGLQSWYVVWIIRWVDASLIQP